MKIENQDAVVITSSYIRVNPVTNVISEHKYISKNGAEPVHIIYRSTYDKSGTIEDEFIPKVDVRV